MRNTRRYLKWSGSALFIGLGLAAVVLLRVPLGASARRPVVTEPVVTEIESSGSVSRSSTLSPGSSNQYSDETNPYSGTTTDLAQQVYLSEFAESDREAAAVRARWIESLAACQIPTDSAVQNAGRAFRDLSTATLPTPAVAVSSAITPPDSDRPDSDTSHLRMSASDERARHWAFRSLSRPAIPATDADDWSNSPIDRFVLTALRREGLQPNPSASRRVLARRLWFDLTGLPPTPQQIDGFVNDPDPRAFDLLAERLLQSPAFGEHWARMWLDLARFADSNGYEEDEMRPNAWPFRDAVIWSMNHDVPFNEFVRWQVAGDEIAPEHPVAVASTGFLAAAPLNTFFPQEIERWDELDDMVSTLFTATLGLSIGCARCHNHVYDPISSREYYQVVSAFVGTRRDQSYLTADRGAAFRVFYDPVARRRAELHAMETARIRDDLIEAQEHLTDAEKNIIRQPIDPENAEQARLLPMCERCFHERDYEYSEDFDFTPLPEDAERFRQLKTELAELEPHVPESPPVGLTIAGSELVPTFVLHGGRLDRKGDQVEPGFLSALTASVPNEVGSGVPVTHWSRWSTADSPAARSALANWLTDTKHGAGSLLARVIVNRLWQQHFDRGLVGSLDNFGYEGEQPTHPKLLEWLACELVDSGWSLKHIHRLIVTSTAWQQSSECSGEKFDRDPQNRWLARFPLRRLTAEMTRDALLSAGGTLTTVMYGPGIRQPIPAEAVFHTQQEKEETWPCNTSRDRAAIWRRSAYLTRKRTVPIPLMQLFDAPSAGRPCSERKTTTVPTQGLALWNSDFVRRQAERLAARLVRETGVDPVTSDDLSPAIDRLLVIAFGREATEEERQQFERYVFRHNAKFRPKLRTLHFEDLCHAILMSSEFLYVE